MAQQPPGEHCWVPDGDRTRLLRLMEAGLKTGDTYQSGLWGRGKRTGRDGRGLKLERVRVKATM